MKVITRSGKSENVDLNKISTRIQELCNGLENIDAIVVAIDTVKSLYDGITTVELDNLSADICATKSHRYPDYSRLGGRILASNLTKNTNEEYLLVVEKLYQKGILSETFYQFVKENHIQLQSYIDYSRDFLFDYFAMKTLERSYLYRIDDHIIERPQHLWMRVAIQVHGCVESPNLKLLKQTYDDISLLYFTHATPTLFNSGSKNPQLSSCFLYSSEDSIEDIFKTISDTAKISKWAGGIGLSLSNIRAKGSIIRGTNGKSQGIIPLCKTLEMVGKYINQGGKRNGSIAVYVEPWHADIFEFVELRKNTGDENMRARDLFLALWIPDLFMKRVEVDDVWSLMCPDECPGLVDSCGEDFEQKYISYEKEKRYKKQVKARELWNMILQNQIETGMPYMAFKDNVNKRNMQSQLGVIRNSNLCCEIALVSNKENYAVCNLASICLPRFVEEDEKGEKTFNFNFLEEISGRITRNLNNVIDVNFYPTPETRKTNMENRPIGIGVQGLADVYCMMGYSFGSDNARELNRRIFETIYYGSVKMSIFLAKQHGSYPNYQGSPHSNGKLQFHFWDNAKTTLDWNSVLEEMKQYGMRNSLLTALMPTASTAQIMGNNEAFEPFTTNIYVRKTLAGEFTVVNSHLIKDLIKRGLWTDDVYEEIVYDNGSIQRCSKIPQDIKEIYKTAYELKVTDLLKQAVERSPFVDHMQSMNLFMQTVSFKVLNSSHFYSWKNGLKTGMYYLRTQPAVDPIKFGLDISSVKRIKEERNDYKTCDMCSA